MRIVVFFLLVTVASSRAVAQDSADPISMELEKLWAEQWGVAPATPALLLWELALEPSSKAAVMEAADGSARSLVDTLLATIELSQPLARRLLPGLHVIRDGDPAGPEKPPTWADLRRIGSQLLERIAMDPANARDLRLSRELADYRRPITRWSPSVVGGEVQIWSAWWVDRGDDSQFYLAEADVPDAADWIRRSQLAEGEAGVLTVRDLLPRLHHDALFRRLYVEGIDERTHAGLVGHCMTMLGHYAADFRRLGLPEQEWDPETGRLVGYDAVRLREIALDILARTSSLVPSGYTQHERIRNCFAWWRRARVQAIYYQSPSEVPDLSSFFDHFDRPEASGGVEISILLRELYVQREIRELILDRYGPAQATIVAELIEWIGLSREAAIEHGFNFSYRLRPLRPMPGQRGPMAVIAWEGVRGLIRELLFRLTQVELPGEGLSDSARNSQWEQWWLSADSEARWYRGNAPAASRPRFEPERARADG